MNIDFPFHFDSRGRTAETDDDDHIRDLIEQVLDARTGTTAANPTLAALEVGSDPNITRVADDRLAEMVGNWDFPPPLFDDGGYDATFFGMQKDIDYEIEIEWRTEDLYPDGDNFRNYQNTTLDGIINNYLNENENIQNALYDTF